MVSISLLSLNVERSKHLDAIIKFLKENKPDVFALQECMEFDVPRFAQTLGYMSHFTPLCVISRAEEREGKEGCAIFAKNIIVAGEVFYAGEYNPIPTHTEDKLASILRVAKAITHAEIEKDGERFTVATTHFTWSPGGEVTEEQKKDLKSLLEKLQLFDEFVLTGDFNAPRGRATWDTIAAQYKDNIPAHYTSSIDPTHRAGELPYVIDGLFTTPQYVASDVVLREGLSDHKGVFATISKS